MESSMQRVVGLELGWNLKMATSSRPVLGYFALSVFKARETK